MESVTVSDAWRRAYPGAVAGILVVHGVRNPSHHPGLDRLKEELESSLRSRFSGTDRSALEALSPLQQYAAYFKRYKKTYHLQLQLESIAFKGKSIPRVAALVEAMFMAEMENLLLTAGHDVDALSPPVRLDVAGGSERYVLLNGQEQALKRGDMMMADAQGIISSVLYGPDRRTRMTESTRRALFTVYAPPGIGERAVSRHLESILARARIVSPDATVESLEVYSAA